MNENRKYILTSELPIEFLQIATHVINSYSTGLLRIVRPDDRPEEAILIGSGTFICVGSRYGILTAHHVLKRLYDPCELGLILVEEEHRSTIPVEDLDLIEIAVSGIPGSGPDLAFVGLPLSRVEGISMFKSFYDLDVDREEMLNSPLDPHSAVWFVNGIPDVFTIDEPSNGLFEVARSFHGLCGAGGANRVYMELGFDYIEVIVQYLEEADLPVTFGGISGGGLWQVMAEGELENLKPNRYILSGMPFAETTEIIDGERTILCHGPISLYDICHGMLQ